MKIKSISFFLILFSVFNMNASEDAAARLIQKMDDLETIKESLTELQQIDDNKLQNDVDLHRRWEQRLLGLHLINARLWYKDSSNTTPPNTTPPFPNLIEDIESQLQRLNRLAPLPNPQGVVPCNRCGRAG